MDERDPEIERNFIIFMVVVMICLFGWMYFSARNAQKKPLPQQKSVVQETSPAKQEPAPEITEPETIPSQKPEESQPLQLAQNPEIEEKTITVTSPLYKIVFSNKGGVPISWELLKYKDRVYFPYEISLKWPPFKRVEKFTPQPVQLIRPELKDKPPLRSRIVVNGMEIQPDTLWDVEAKDISVENGPAEVEFRLTLSQGVVLKKIYTFYPDQYRSELKIEYSGLEPDPKQSWTELELSYWFEPKSRLARLNFHGALNYTGKSLVRFNTNDLNKKFLSAEKAKTNPQELVSYEKKSLTVESVDWTGFTDSYFLTAILARSDTPLKVWAYFDGTMEMVEDKNASKEYAMKIKAQPGAQDISSHCLTQLELYFGPKEKQRLEKVRKSLAAAIDYGKYLGVIAIPMMYALIYTNKLVHNFGWSIVILTIILRMAMFPITRKGQKSMKELQKLQPEMEKIRKKYPDDRLKQQEELTALYRKYKINPMGGCLPILIQIPIFFAFYRVLLVSIELRHAPWILWIQDLSSRDPLLILPLLMGLSQFFMQKLTPTTTMDPTQAKMMMLMPLVFTFMLVYFPSGLLLYWTVSNIIGIAQQIYVNKVSE